MWKDFQVDQIRQSFANWATIFWAQESLGWQEISNFKMATFWATFKKRFFFTFSPKLSVSELVALIVMFH